MNIKAKFYQPELDGLRFFAFLAVFISHCFSQDPAYYVRAGLPESLATWIARGIASGGNGVPLFFILSSYLITELLLREHEKRGKIDVKAFYMRRILRIWPLYFAFLLAVFIFIPHDSPYGIRTRTLAALLLFSGNWISIYGGFATHSLAGPLWSVSVEEQFYLIWPLLINRIGPQRIKTVAIAFIAIAMLIRAGMDISGRFTMTAVWGNTFAWLDSIAAGTLLAVVLRGATPRFGSFARFALLLSGVALWVISARGYGYLPLRNLIHFPFIIVGSLAMMLGALGSHWLSNTILVYLGRISYGLYVLHPVGMAVAGFVFPEFSFLYAATGLISTVLCAALAYRFLEAPFLRLKKRFTYIESQPGNSKAELAEPEPASL
jgi:peptidoglycan/LPS O-acetylase OafA/YrhL